MDDWTILHDPQCSTSRAGLQLLEDAGLTCTIIDYRTDRPTMDRMEQVLGKLGIPAEALLRKKEPIYQERFAGQQHSDREWLAIMLEHPELIERPIVIKNGKAVIGRPLERITELIG